MSRKKTHLKAPHTEKLFKNNRTLRRGVVEALCDPGVRSLLGLTASLIVFGGIFYSLVEGWEFIDAIYFSTVTISTVGYGDLSPQTATGKVFTIGYIIVGIGLFVALASAMADHMIRRARKDLDLLEDKEGSDD